MMSPRRGILIGSHGEVEAEPPESFREDGGKPEALPPCAAAEPQFMSQKPDRERGHPSKSAASISNPALPYGWGFGHKTPTDQRSDPKSLLISNVSTLQSVNEI